MGSRQTLGAQVEEHRQSSRARVKELVGAQEEEQQWGGGAGDPRRGGRAEVIGGRR